MNDRIEWLDKFGDELAAAAQRMGSRRGATRARRIVVVAACGLLLLGGTAFAANAIWNDNPPEPTRASGIVADPGEAVETPTIPPSASSSLGPGDVVVSAGACEFDGDLSARSSNPMPTELTRQLAVLRDSKSESLPRYARFGDPVFEDAVAVVSGNSGKEFTVAAVDSNAETIERLPDTPECERFKNQKPTQARICVAESGKDGGQFCATPASIANARGFLVEDRMSGLRKGEARVFGIAPDGVTQVSAQFHSDLDIPDRTIAVRDNLFEFEYNGAASVPPTISFNSR